MFKIKGESDIQSPLMGSNVDKADKTEELSLEDNTEDFFFGEDSQAQVTVPYPWSESIKRFLKGKTLEIMFNFPAYSQLEARTYDY